MSSVKTCKFIVNKFQISGDDLQQRNDQHQLNAIINTAEDDVHERISKSQVGRVIKYGKEINEGIFLYLVLEEL